MNYLSKDIEEITMLQSISCAQIAEILSNKYNTTKQKLRRRVYDTLNVLKHWGWSALKGK
jgi:hypothetical protein